MTVSAIVLSPPGDIVKPAYPDGENVIPVFLGCDDGFLPHALTVIASVMAHADSRNSYDIFIVQSGIPRERMDIAAAWMTRYPNASLRFIDIDPALAAIRDDLVIMRRYGAATYFRIFAPEIFGRYKRIVYLDSDFIVLGDVADFFKLDLDGMQAGAVQDPIITSHSLSSPEVAEFWRTQLGMRPGEAYFNAGALVMDLEAMRRENTQQEFFRRIREIEGATMPDQDVMNSVLRGKVKMLPCEWNCFEWMCDGEEEASDYLQMRAEFLPAVRAARERVKIIHYVGKKPWTMAYSGKSAGEYWKYAAETPFYRQSLEQLRRECTPGGLLVRRIAGRVQEGNFLLKRLLAPKEKQRIYDIRLYKLRWRRKRLALHREFVETLLKTAAV